MTSGEMLDEVVVSGRLRYVYDKKGPPFEGSVIKITDSVAKRFPNMAKILDTEKFLVNYGADIKITAMERSYMGGPRPILFHMDGQVIRRPENVRMLLTSPTVMFEDIYVDYSTNFVYHPDSFMPMRDAIIIHAFSRRTNFKSPELNQNATSISKQVKHGFEPTKEFYTPRYIDYSIPSFRDYGVIHWIPNFTLNGNENKHVPIFNTGLDEVNLYVEGITSEGDLISQVIPIYHLKKP